MKKNQIIIIVVAVLLLAGGVFALVGKSDSKTDNSESKAASTESASKDVNKFDPVSTTGLSFVATITTKINDKDFTSTMEADAKTGAVKYVSNAQGENMTFVYTKDSYYMCMGATKCYKYTLGQGSGATFDPSSYQYDAKKISQYQSSSTSAGLQDCKAGKCNVWKVKTGEYESSVFIDQKTKRVSEVRSNTAAGASTIVYEYKDVVVEIPTNAEEVPSSL